MTYIINTLKAEIKNLDRYLQQSKDWLKDVQGDSQKFYKKEINRTKKLIQQHKDVIVLLKAYKKGQQQ